MTPEQASIRKRFLAVDTTTVSDVLEKVGRYDQALSTALTPIARRFSLIVMYPAALIRSAFCFRTGSSAGIISSSYQRNRSGP